LECGFFALSPYFLSRGSSRGTAGVALSKMQGGLNIELDLALFHLIPYFKISEIQKFGSMFNTYGKSLINIHPL
jgi:hypothetical protein